MPRIRTVLRVSLLSVVAACFSPSDPGPPAGDPGSQTGPACPHLQLKAPDVVPAGQRAQVSVSLIGPAIAPTFHWKVTEGSIASGQGTPNILVDTAGVAGRAIRATVELGGLPPECMTTAGSAGFLIGPPNTTTSIDRS